MKIRKLESKTEEFVPEDFIGKDIYLPSLSSQMDYAFRDHELEHNYKVTGYGLDPRTNVDEEDRHNYFELTDEFGKTILIQDELLVDIVKKRRLKAKDFVYVGRWLNKTFLSKGKVW